MAWAVCDGDPLKLHYSWCLSRLGIAPPARFDLDLAACRRAFTAGALGFADLVLVQLPPLEVLRSRRDGDTTRRRRHFDMHAQLRMPLSEWYQAVDKLDPGRVLWKLPADGVPAQLPKPRPARSDVELLDALVAALPAR